MNNQNFLPFREFHILSIFNGYEKQKLPIDLFLKDYFKSHPAIGSKDRTVIADTTYSMIRWKGLLDYLCAPSPTWEKRLELFLKWDHDNLITRTDIPLHIRLGFPKLLFDLIVDSHGQDKAIEICQVLNTPAPTTIRVNPLKISRDALLQRWKNTYNVTPCLFSELGIIFEKRINFFELPEFREGFFEIQDEGSQLLAGLVQAIPGQLVLDFCAGAGGKTLAFAPQMQNKGQIYLHDIRNHALLDAKKRLKRAGIQNAQIICGDEQKMRKLKKKMDWVLVDAPCTGTGTIRRNPDMKWSFSEEYLKNMVSQQRVIFERALSYMKPEGRIVYATCSLLRSENHDQMAHFIKTYGLEIVSNPVLLLPKKGGMDGFFGAILKKIEY